jgi:hypothetical protein
MELAVHGELAGLAESFMTTFIITLERFLAGMDVCVLL